LPPPNTVTTIIGAQFVTLGEVAVVPLGAGEALVSGPITQVGGSATDGPISASFDLNGIFLGKASEIPLINLPDIEDMSTQNLLKQLPAIIGQHGGNIFNGPEDNLIAADGEKVLDNDTGGIASTIKELLQAGASSMIASGTATLAAPKAQGAATVGAGLVSVAVGGTVVTAGGGAVANDALAKIADDTAEVINTNGSNVVNTNGSNATNPDAEGAAAENGAEINTSGDTSGLFTTPGGNIIAGGGGNIVAAGGGNIVAAGGGNIVAAGGGNIIAGGGGN
jgi:hypothetical protein